MVSRAGDQLLARRWQNGGKGLLSKELRVGPQILNG